MQIESLTDVPPFILTGEQGCGKTRIATELADTLGLEMIVDDWWPGQSVPQVNTLYVTSAWEDLPRFGSVVILTYDAAAALLANQNREAA